RFAAPATCWWESQSDASARARAPLALARLPLRGAHARLVCERQPGGGALRPTTGFRSAEPPQHHLDRLARGRYPGRSRTRSARATRPQAPRWDRDVAVRTRRTIGSLQCTLAAGPSFRAGAEAARRRAHALRAR